MGRVKKSVSNGLTTTTIYDVLGRKYTETEADGNGYAIFRGYFYEGISPYVREELTGQYHLLLYSDKTYEYDGEMRIVKVKESGNETASYTYDANGNKKSETLANGVVSTYTYNKANRITKIENKSGNSTISSYEYSYYFDGSDACKKRNEGGIIETTEYEYDGLKRLTEESVKVGNKTSDTYSYEYDDYGNRSKMTATGTENYETVYEYSVNGKYTALLQKETKTVEDENALKLQDNVKQTFYTYDSNGNQVKKVADGKTETNTYDGLNQLIGFTDGETTASYKYNVSGLRYEKTVDGQTINHVWDGSKQIIADVIDNQFYEADCYIRGTNLVAKYNYRNGDKSEYTYYTQNAHGDVVNLTDKDGKVTKKYTYDAFGVEKNIDKNDTNAFRYCGEYYDTETGTIYLRARYYNPTTGRFISRDSFAGRKSDPLSLNLYTYCRNNPLRYVDPSGHITVNSQWDWAYCVAKGDINYEYDGGNGEISQKAKNILTYSRASAEDKVKMKKGAPGCKHGECGMSKWKAPEKNIEQYKIDFIEPVYNNAKMAEKNTKVPAAIVAAQACLESDYGHKVPYDRFSSVCSYNLFGIKGVGTAGSVNCLTEEEDENGNRYSIYDDFRAYNSYEESIIDHSKFLRENSRYDFLFELEITDLNGWAQGLQSAGYATASDYADEVMSVINYWGLE